MDNQKNKVYFFTFSNGTPGASAHTEVRNMLIAEYSYETDIKVQRREAYREGAEQTKIETAKKLLKEDLPVEQIARCTDLPLEKVIQLKEEILNQKKLENI